MKEPATRDALEIEVADFGPIVEAKVDLRPLTVFIGPSNTGKSYLAILIYALHRFFGGDPGLRGWHVPPGFYHFGRSPTPLDLPEESVDAVLEMARSLATDAEATDGNSITLPSRIAESLRSGFDVTAQSLAREVARCFGISDPAAIIRRGRSSAAHVVVRRQVPSHADLMTHTVTLTRDTSLNMSIPSGVPVLFGAQVDDRVMGLDDLRMWLRNEFKFLSPNDCTADGSPGESFASYLLKLFGDILLPSLVGPLHLPAYYLPAGRIGVMHAHRVVVSALIASASAADLRPAANTPKLSGVLADFLDQLIGIGRSGRPRRNVGRDLGSSIEDNILRGSVRIERSALIDYPHFTYRPQGWKDDLSLANASSMVSELAPVVLYLRHVIEPGNVLIVEEPESHLHPAMQVEFTRQLAALVEAGVRVIVTTHSEWLVEELGNIVGRSKLPEGTDNRIALRPDQVGAWLFDPKQRPKKGSVVRELVFDEYGLGDTGFDDVASALHNDWAETQRRAGEHP